MNGERDALDRLTLLFEPPDRSFEAFLRLRDRKRRNERLVAAALASIIASVAIGSLLLSFRVSEHRPAARPITPENISQLRLRWTGDTGGSAWAPAVADGVVYAGTFPMGYAGSSFGDKHGRLFAFTEDCAGGAQACDPLWTADTGSVGGPTVADGTVYAAESRWRADLPDNPGPKTEHYLYAFASDCGVGGATCTAEWRGAIGAGVAIDMMKPVVSGNTVYIATDTVYAFDVGCRTDGGVCPPRWSAPIGADATALAVVGGRLFVGTAGQAERPDQGGLLAFGTTCGTGGATCPPLWKLSSIDGVWGLSAAQGVVFVGTSRSLFALPAHCKRTYCSPIWTAAPRATGGFWVGPVIDGEVFAFDQNLGLYAFPSSCGSGGATCQPTWTGIVPLLSSAPPVVADGVVYVGTQTGEAYGFPTRCSDRCSPIWRVDTATDDDWIGVTVADGMVFLGASSAQGIPDALSAYGLRRGAVPARERGSGLGVILIALLLLICSAAWLVRIVLTRSKSQPS